MSHHPPRRRRAPLVALAAFLLLLPVALVAAAPAAAQTDLLLSEYVEGSSLNKAVEIFNPTGSAVDLAASGYELRLYFNGSSSAGTIVSLTGTVAAGDVWVVVDDGADPGVLSRADQLSTASFFNGDDAVVLTKGFGATVVDSIGQVGFDPGSEWGSGATSTQNNTLRRKATACTADTDTSDAFDPSVDWDGFAQDTFDGLGSFTASCGPVDPVINEFVVNHTGTDTNEFVEVFGAPSTDYTGFQVLEIEGDSATGTVDAVFALGTTDGSGFWTTGFLNNQIENGSVTLLLVEGYTGLVGDDLDADDDGVVDAPAPWTRLVDAVALSDGDAGDLTYGLPVLAGGFDGVSFDVGGASRIPNGSDTDAASDWVRNDFDGEGIPALEPGSPVSGEALNTPGAVNETVDGGTTTFQPLLLTEIVVTPTGGEFIEIHNPNSAAVDLSDVYLTDATFAPGGTFYYNLPTGSGAGGGGFSDFNARFPAGASIAPGAYQTIAIAGSDDFFATWGVAPDYELYEDGASADAVPDLREATAGSINGQGGLTNSGEVVVLYAWDGASDLVVDLDYAVWGDKDEAIDKTGVSIDGPDADATATAFAADTAIASQEVISIGGHSSGESFVRLDLAEGTETQSGGNGAGGSDETSENLSQTWAISTAPTPGEGEPSGWIVNEINADPDTSLGDANGDGSANFSQDEFVEIVNNTGASVDISGWTLADGFGVRHVFPVGTVVADGCGVLVFGGGTPSGTFGGFVVQTASDGSLGLNNGGDSVTLNDGGADVATASYGGEGGDNQSLTLDPDLTGTSYVKHTLASGSGGALFSPGTRIDGSLFGGCSATPTELEIWEIQGPGLASPVANTTVTTRDNVVTAVGVDGFFMQTPDARIDADPETSNGIFVFTGSTPAVTAGDRVDVTGTVIEFFDLTEFTSAGLSVTVVGSGPVPAPVVFDATTPSPLQPQPATELERYEGMLVSLVDGLASGPTDRFGDLPVVAQSSRSFREPGIAFPGLPGLPVWDGNPELFEVDPDRLLPALAADVPAEATVSATGGFGFSFGDYQIWPTSLTVVGTPQTEPVRERLAGESTIGSLNLFRLFDDVDDPGSEDDGQVVSTAEYQSRLEKFSRYIREVLRSPDILAVQEVESLSVLQDLAARIQADDATVSYTAYLVEGNDVGGIDVGFLVRSAVTVDAVTQLAATETLTFDGSLLHDRPPLLLEARLPSVGVPYPVKVLVLHQRSLGGIDDPVDGPRVRQKRLEQAQSVAAIVDTLQTADPNVRLTVIGDFNAYEFTDGYVDVTGQIAGDLVPGDNLLSGPDLVTPDLAKEVFTLPAAERYSFVFDGSAQVLDHALTSVGLAGLVTGFEYGRGNADAPAALLADATTALRSSDHDGLVLFLGADDDGDGVTDLVDNCPGTFNPDQADADNDGLADACADRCLGTRVPEASALRGLRPKHYALVDSDDRFDTVTVGSRAPLEYTLEDTAGCSCEQIVDDLGLGRGHLFHGCNQGIMSRWVSQVSP